MTAFVRRVIAFSQERGVDVEGHLVDVNEHRLRLAEENGIGGGDEAEGGGDDLVACTYPAASKAA